MEKIKQIQELENVSKYFFSNLKTLDLNVKIIIYITEDIITFRYGRNKIATFLPYT